MVHRNLARTTIAGRSYLWRSYCIPCLTCEVIRVDPPNAAVESALAEIFINYHRKDRPDFAYRLAEHLRGYFGHERVFIDIDSIPAGSNYREAIDSALKATKVFLSGKYMDKIVFENGGYKFREKIVVYDTLQIPSMIVIPI